jgi:hypothetical protein
VREQRQCGPVYSLHAPEVEYIGNGKAHRRSELGVKVLVATTLSHTEVGQFVSDPSMVGLRGSGPFGHQAAVERRRGA